MMNKLKRNMFFAAVLAVCATASTGANAQYVLPDLPVYAPPVVLPYTGPRPVAPVYSATDPAYPQAYADWRVADNAWVAANGANSSANSIAKYNADNAYTAAKAAYQSNLNAAVVEVINGLPVMSATPDGAMAVGSNAVAVGANAVAVGENALAADGGIAIGADSVSDTSISIAIGQGAHAVSSVAIGVSAQAVGLNTTAIGDYAAAQGARSVAIGANANAIGANSVALGAGSVATRANSVEVGGRQITGVATPTQPTDAANKAYVDNAVGRVGRIEERVQDIDKKASSGVAIALAMPPGIGLAPGESAVSVGTGAFGGQGAIAASFAHNVKLEPLKEGEERLFDEVVLSAGLGASNSGEVGFKASITFKF